MDHHVLSRAFAMYWSSRPDLKNCLEFSFDNYDRRRNLPEKDRVLLEYSDMVCHSFIEIIMVFEFTNMLVCLDVLEVCGDHLNVLDLDGGFYQKDPSVEDHLKQEYFVDHIL